MGHENDFTACGDAVNALGARCECAEQTGMLTCARSQYRVNATKGSRASKAGQRARSPSPVAAVAVGAAHL